MNRLAFAGIGLSCGVLAACPYLVALTSPPGSMILVYLTQLPLFVAGLWFGVGACAIAGIVASLILLAASNVAASAIFAGLDAAPVVVLVRQSLLARMGPDGAVEWYPPGLLTAWLTGLGLMGIAAALVWLGGPEGVQAALREVLAPVVSGHIAERRPEHDELLDFLVFVLPGIVASSWMVMTLTNGSLAQGLLARFGASWRPSPDVAALALPRWIPLLLALAVAATILGAAARFVAINVMIVLGVPFCLAGLAVLHTLARRLSSPVVALVTFYVLTAIFGWPLLLVAVLGLLDSSLGLRRRLAQP